MNRKLIFFLPVTLGFLASLQPNVGNTELSVVGILSDMTDSAGEWMTGPLESAPPIGWAAVNSAYVVFDPDLEGIPLEDGEYYVLLETTPGVIENIYPIQGNRVRKTFDFRETPMDDGFYIYQVKKCGILGCQFVGRPLLVFYYLIFVDDFSAATMHRKRP